jgi:hypothetical protein
MIRCSQQKDMSDRQMDIFVRAMDYACQRGIQCSPFCFRKLLRADEASVQLQVNLMALEQHMSVYWPQGFLAEMYCHFVAASIVIPFLVIKCNQN